MTSSSARFADLQRKYEENPRRFFAPLANELRRSGNARRAAEICREYLAHLPEHLSGHVVLAQALADLGDRDEARSAFERVLVLDPENVVALRALGDMDAQLGERDQARGWYERLLQVDPRDGEVTTRLATLELPAVPESPSPAAPSTHDAHDAHDAHGAYARPSGATLAGDAADWSFAPSAAEGLIDEARDDATDDEAAPTAGARAMRDDEDGEEFTAGFFASVLEPERPRANAEPVVDLDAALARPVGAEPDLAPADIDRLLSDLPALGDELPRSSDVAASLTPWGELPGADATVAPTEPLGAESPLSPTFDDLVPPAAADEPAGPLAAAAEPVLEPLREDDDEDRAAAFGVAPAEPEAPAPFVTETMATLYLQQGHRAQALQMYEQLVRESPDDAALRGRYEALRAEEPAAAETPAADPSATAVAAAADDAEDRRDGGVQRAAAIVVGAAFAAGMVYTVSGWLRSLVQGEQPGDVVGAAATDAPALDAAVVEPAAAAAGAPEGPRDEQPAFGDETDAAAALDAAPADAAWTGEPHAAPASERDVTATAVPADVGDAATFDAQGADAVASEDAGATMFAPEGEAPIGADAEAAVDLAASDETHVGASAEDAWQSAGLAEAADAATEPAAPTPPAAEVLDEPWIASDDSAISVAADATAEESAGAEFELTDDDALVIADVEPVTAADAMPPVDGGVAAAEAEPVEEAELVEAGAAALPAAEWEVPEESSAVAELETAPASDASDDPFAFDVVEPAPELEGEVELEMIDAGSAEPAAAEPADDPFAWGEAATEPGAAAAGRAGVWAQAEPISLERLSERPVPHADEVAAGALAAAAVSLQNDAALDAQLREASLDDPTSIELLLRSGGRPSRPNAGFSFDQFFQTDPSRRPDDVAAPAGHAESGAHGTPEDEDRDHFHAWLAGLSKS